MIKSLITTQTHFLSWKVLLGPMNGFFSNHDNGDDDDMLGKNHRQNENAWATSDKFERLRFPIEMAFRNEFCVTMTLINDCDGYDYWLLIRSKLKLNKEAKAKLTQAGKWAQKSSEKDVATHHFPIPRKIPMTILGSLIPPTLSDNSRFSSALGHHSSTDSAAPLTHF